MAEASVYMRIPVLRRLGDRFLVFQYLPGEQRDSLETQRQKSAYAVGVQHINSFYFSIYFAIHQLPLDK